MLSDYDSIDMKCPKEGQSIETEQKSGCLALEVGREAAEAMRELSEVAEMFYNCVVGCAERHGVMC